MAGFRSPLFLLGLGAGATQAGFQNPLPVPPLAGGAEIQAGYVTPIPVLRVYGNAAIIEPEVEQTHGSDSTRKRRNEEALHRKRLLREDEEILAVVMTAISNGVI